MGKMIKGVLIYDSETGLDVYHKYHNNDIRAKPHQLSALASLLNAVFESKNDLLVKELYNFKFDQFTFNYANDIIEVDDKNGVHSRLHLHRNNGLAGLFSVSKDVCYCITSSLFDDLVIKIKQEHICVNRDIEPKLRRELDELLKPFF